MARFNTPDHKSKAAVSLATSPLRTVSKTSDARTFEGAAGWTRTPQTELFLRATGALHGGEGTFYENGKERDEKLRELVRAVVVEDFDWSFEFARWLRGPGNMRTASLMFAVEAVHESLEEDKRRLEIFSTALGNRPQRYTNRQLIDVVCQRPDEPGELLAIWTAWYGRKIPQPVKRGLADAVRRKYSEYSLLKYDTPSHGYRFGDVLNIVHAAPDSDKPVQGALFRYALDRRHNPDTAIPDVSLAMVNANDALRDRATRDPKILYNTDALREAGMTWEDTLSLGGKVKADNAKLWEALIPAMGIMALIRNLRNFDQAGISDKVAQQVIDQLTDPDEIARSKQFPFRFLAAYRATEGSLRWAYPLEKALNHSLSNVPRLGGRTLVLVDRSPSMFPEYYVENEEDKRFGMPRADQAAIFGCALALRADSPTLVEFGGTSREITVPKGVSVLKLVEMFDQDAGTDIPSAVKRHYAGHDRVIIITDEQTRAGYLPSNVYRHYNWPDGMETTAINDLIPVHIPVYMWNLAGYTPAAMPSGNEARFTMGGLTQDSFRIIKQLESGNTGTWPWENSS